jgi:hypothetical protein
VTGGFVELQHQPSGLKRKSVPRSADRNRQDRRNIIKTIGKRQFKKLYRKAP